MRLKEKKLGFFNINKVNKTLYETENKNILDKFRNTEYRNKMRNRAKNRFTKIIKI